MTTEQRWNFLLLASKQVLAAFRSGANPTFEQIDKLDMAVHAVTEQRICGHPVVDDCDCHELDPAAFVVLEAQR